MYTSNWFLWSDVFSQASEAARTAQDAQMEIKALRDRLDRMALLSLAMWTLAREKLGITDQELAERVQQLDLSDGKLDGKIAPGVSECPKCHRMLSPRHNRCIYCGTPRENLMPM